MTRCQWWPGYASWTAVVGMPGYEFDASRFWISSSDAPSGGNGTKKWPSILSLNGGGDM